MTHDEIRNFVRVQADAAPNIGNHASHLREILVEPKQISVVAHTMQHGTTKEEVISVWLIAQENSSDGYRIVMRSDGSSFGLATSGYSADRRLFLCGWYGDLASTFASM